MVCWSPTQLNSKQVVLSSPFQGWSLLLASDGLWLAAPDQENIAKVSPRGPQQISREREREARREIEVEYHSQNESCVDCHSSQPNNVGCDTKCFSNRYEITRYPATATTTQQHPIHLTSQYQSSAKKILWNKIPFLIKFCFPLVSWVIIMSYFDFTPKNGFLLKLDNQYDN